MPKSTRRLLMVVAVLTAVSVMGFIVAYAFQWPSRFVLGGEPDSRVTIGDIVNGTPLSIPLPPWIALLLLTALATSQRWWGTIGAALLVALGALFMFGGFGELLGEANPDVPSTVLVIASLIWIALGVSLSVAAIVDLRWRLRERRASQS